MPLLLDRTLGESIMIGDDIRIELIGVRGNRIRLCFHAPAHIRIDRLEVYERKQMERDHAATRTGQDISIQEARDLALDTMDKADQRRDDYREADATRSKENENAV